MEMEKPSLITINGVVDPMRMWRHVLLTVLFACLITVLTHYYLYLRLVVPIVGRHNEFWISVFIGLCSFTLFGFLLIRILPHILRKIFEFIMFLWIGVAFIALVLSLITAPINLVLQYKQIDTLYVWYFLVIATSLLSVYAIFNALKEPSIFRVTLPVKQNFPKEIEKLKIAVLSDIHISGLIGKKRVQKITNIVNSLDVDVVCVTGDVMDGSVEQLYTQLEPFKALKAKKSIVYITGNHEFYSGPNQWKEFFKNTFDWNVLSNISHVIPFENFHLNIFGIEDRHWLKYVHMSPHKDERLERSIEHFKQNLKDEQKFSYNVLLAHQPKDWKQFIQFPWINLQISGHTHGGGQIWPLQYIVKRDQKYYAGLYRISQTNQHIYVNRGTGFWGPPMRLGTASEITLITFATA